MAYAEAQQVDEDRQKKDYQGRMITLGGRRIR